MKRFITLCAVGALVFAVAGCVGVRRSARTVTAHPSADHGWEVSDLLASVKIETTLDGNAIPQETEYHIRPDEVPQAVRDAMEAMHPGGHYVGAEKEINDGRLYYELAKEIDGYEVEAMFKPDGTSHDQEITVPESKVPASVKDAVMGMWPNATVNAWEEIKNGKGELVEYHVKLSDADRNYKVIVTTGGTVTAAYREIPAEIEVPVALPK